VALLPAAKHNPPREAPEATLAVVTDFVSRVSQTNGWAVPPEK
jgi:hypothetical protein